MTQLSIELHRAGAFCKLRSMRVAAAAIFCGLSAAAIAEPAPHPMSWITVSEWHVATSQTRMWGPATLEDPQPWTGLYFRGNVSDPYPDPQLQPSTWYEVDLTPFGVADDATVAFLSGILIITHGNSSEIADVRVTMARADDTTADCSKYIGQTIEASVGGGQRSNMATFVPLYHGKFKFCFTHGNGGVYPSGSAYGINLSLQAWGR